MLSFTDGARLGRLALVPLALLAGCGDNGASSDDAGAADMAVKGDMARIRPDLWMPTGCIKGVIKDEMDKAVGMVQVLNCSSTTCITGTAGGDGLFNTCGIALTDIASKTEEECKHMPRYGAGVQFVSITKNEETVDAQTIWVPIMGAGSAIDRKGATPATLDGGDSVFVTLKGADLSYIGDPDCTLAARMMPKAKWPNLNLPDKSTPVAYIVLSPFAASSKSKVALKAKLPTPIAANAAVEFFFFDYLASGWDPKPALGHADKDGAFVSTDPNEGITQLTYVAVTTK